MADVQVNQSPGGGTGSSGWIWAIVVLVVVALIAWFVFAGGPGGGGNETRIEVETPPAPFLKWAGGKRQLLPVLRTFYPHVFRGYVEPFIGSAAVLFDLFALGRLAGRPITIADRNADLIGCYRALRDDVEGVIEALR